jgi:hypothetical protein
MNQKALYIANCSNRNFKLGFRIKLDEDSDKAPVLRYVTLASGTQAVVLQGRELHKNFEKMSHSALSACENVKRVLELFANRFAAKHEKDKNFNGNKLSGLVWSFGKPIDTQSIKITGQKYMAEEVKKSNVDLQNLADTYKDAKDMELTIGKNKLDEDGRILDKVDVVATSDDKLKKKK